ncbi:unnamed protein product [Arabidopsis lyrata]|nr:unnamed protein product [Arabidopsis lyrata]
MYSLILHGRKLVQFQKWRHLRVSVNLYQDGSAFSNSFSSAASASDVSPRVGRKGNNFTVSYLVDSLGLPNKLAESISRKVSFEDKGNPDSVLSLLRSHGFTDSQISSIITDYPVLLIADADKSLGPKLQFLQSRGASSSELTEIVSAVPKILGKKEGKSISAYYDFVKVIIEADKSSNMGRICHSLPEGSKQENKIRNVLVLRELGVPQRVLFSLLLSDGRHVCGKEKFKESLKKVVKIGFDPTTSMFVEALKSEKKIENSIETFLGLGFSRDEFLMMVKRFPQCIGYSTEYLVKEMNWPLKAVASIPQVLGYSLEKRTVPRCNVIKVLISKGLFGSELPPISSVLTSPREKFLNCYVRKHDDKQLVAELLVIFTGDSVSLTDQKTRLEQ